MTGIFFIIIWSLINKVNLNTNISNSLNLNSSVSYDFKNFVFKNEFDISSENIAIESKSSFKINKKTSLIIVVFLFFKIYILLNKKGFQCKFNRLSSELDGQFFFGSKIKWDHITNIDLINFFGLSQSGIRLKYTQNF